MLSERESRQLISALVNSIRFNVNGEGMISLESTIQIVNTFLEDGIYWKRIDEDGRASYKLMIDKKDKS